MCVCVCVCFWSFYNHTSLITHEDYSNDTKLSKEYWKIKKSDFIQKSKLEHRKRMSTIEF